MPHNYITEREECLFIQAVTEKMKIIDGHMHITQWVRNDGKSAFEMIEDYRQNNGIAYVDNMCCSNNANLWSGYEMDQSILGAIAKIENPYVFTHGCLYIPQDAEQIKKYDFKSQLEELMEIGLDGVKICDFKPDAYKILNVESRLEDYDEYIGYCEKYGVHMCWHVADPDFFWDETKVSEQTKKAGWFYGNGTYPTYESLIAFAYKMIEKHPKLNLLLAHAFFKSNEPDEIEALLEKHPNVNIDLAPGSEMFGGFGKYYDKWYNIFRKYSDRFVYATDASTSQTSERRAFLSQSVLRFLQTDDVFDFSNYEAHGIKLEQEHLDNILYKNHERTVGITPKEINKKALKKYIDRYLPLMPDSKNKRSTEEYYRKNLL